MKITNLSNINTLNQYEAAQAYNQMGFSLVAILPMSKKAFKPDWQNNPEAAEFWKENPDYNMGVLLKQSRICTLDIDSLDNFKKVCEALDGNLIESEKPFWLSSTAGIKSGRAGSAKLVFRIPENISVPYCKLSWRVRDINNPSRFKNECIFEIRTIGQDLLPPSTHPETKQKYQWVGADEILDIPDDLLYLAQNWKLYENIMLRANPDYEEESTPNTYAAKKIKDGGKWKFLKDWCETQNIEELLLKYGYTKKGGKGRFLSPDSHSGAAGIQVYGNKFYSFGMSDYFGDGKIHDAFDLVCHYEYQDDRKAAINHIKREVGVIEEDRTQLSIHIEKPYFDGSKFLCEDLARDMVKKYDKKIAFIDGLLYVKNDSGVYEMNDDLLKKIISEFQTNLTDNQKAEVIKALSTTHDIHVFTTNFSNPNLIPFKTAVYDLENDRLINYTDDMVFGYKLPFDYDQAAKPTALVDKILNDLSCGNAKRRALMEEGLGYALYHDNDLARGKALILTGKTHSGKSTYQDLCRIVLTGSVKPSKITTSIKLHNFTNMGNKTEYYIADLVNSWLNIGDDISAQNVKNTDAIKSLISGEPLTGRSCGSSKIIDFIPKTKFIFSCNSIPLMKDEGGALSSRFVFIQFDNEFRTKGYLDENPESKANIIDTKLMNKLMNDKDSLAYLVCLAVNGLRRLKENNDFTTSDYEKNLSESFTKECDTVSSWIEDMIGDTPEEIRLRFLGKDRDNCITSIRQWYNIYEMWCKDGRLPSETLRAFSAQIQNTYNLKSKSMWVRPMDIFSGQRYGKEQKGRCFA